MNPELSRVIYSQLLNGRAINQHQKEGQDLVENPLFNELYQNWDSYRNLYLMIGFELHAVGNAYVVREWGTGGHYAEVASQVQVLIDVLGRGVQILRLMPQALTEYRAGLDKKQLELIGSDAEIALILKACGLQKSLSQEVDNILVARDLALYNHHDKLVLSDSGRAFFEELTA